MIPIWKDTIFQSTENILEYSIEVNGDVIYRGRAYKRPNAYYNEIKINKICENYLSNHLTDIISVIFDNPNGVSGYNPEAFKRFTLKDKDGVILKTYDFLYDWSYDDYWNEVANVINLSRPINGKYTTGMYRLNTKVETVSIEGTGSGVVTETRVTNSMLPAYKNIEHCKGEYAIYYLNSYGGWDSFLFEGAVIKEDSVTQYTTDRVYNNTEPEFEMKRYVSEIQTTYKCNTGWLTDEQATNITKNLISTNCCFLHNLKTGEIIPAIVNDNKAMYQRYATNGNMMCQYEINIKSSQTRIRR